MLRLRGKVPINYTVAETASYFVYSSVCLANFKCSGIYTNCGGSSPDRLCIDQYRLCDKKNDCGNNWDELPETCGQFALSFALSAIYNYIQESWAIAKTTERWAHYMGAPENFDSPDQPTATFPEICNGCLFWSILKMCVQNSKFVALPVPEILGVLQKFRQSSDTPTLFILPNF